MQLSSAIVDFHVFYDGPIDMQIKGVSVKPLILGWMLRPVGLLFSIGGSWVSKHCTFLSVDRF